MSDPIGKRQTATGPETPTGPVILPEPTDGGAAETEGWWPQPQSEEEPFNSGRRWAGRLAFPLLALAVVLAWQGVGLEAEAESALPRWGWWTLSALAAGVGLMLVRVRHRRG